MDTVWSDGSAQENTSGVRSTSIEEFTKGIMTNASKRTERVDERMCVDLLEAERHHLMGRLFSHWSCRVRENAFLGIRNL